MKQFRILILLFSTEKKICFAFLELIRNSWRGCQPTAEQSPTPPILQGHSAIPDIASLLRMPGPRCHMYSCQLLNCPTTAGGHLIYLPLPSSRLSECPLPFSSPPFCSPETGRNAWQVLCHTVTIRMRWSQGSSTTGLPLLDSL